MKYLYITLLSFVLVGTILHSKPLGIITNLLKPQYCISAEIKDLLIQQGLSQKAFQAFIERLPSDACLDHHRHILVDFNKKNTSHRLTVFDIGNRTPGILYQTQVAHGARSGSKRYASRFSNKVGSNQSSLGLFSILPKVKRTTNPFSFPVVGLDDNLNSNAYRRLITIHQAKYVKSSYVGRSNGCFAVSMQSIKKLSQLNIAGGYLFAYHDSLSDMM